MEVEPLISQKQPWRLTEVAPEGAELSARGRPRRDPCWPKLPIFGSWRDAFLDPARNGPEMAGFATGSVRQREGAA